MSGEIERNQWAGFLDEFSKRNAIRPARIEIIGEEVGAQEAGDNLPFVGASYERKGTAAGSVEIILGGESLADERHLTHLVEHVERIFPYLNAAGLEEGLEIETREGMKTLLRFEAILELPPAEA